MSGQLPYAIVATDLDGTLLLSKHTVPPLAPSVFQELQQKGVPVIVVTGRHRKDVEKIHTGLGLTSGDNGGSVIFITSNGACVSDAKAGTILFETFIDQNVAEELVRYLPPTEEGINTNIYQNDNWYSRLDWPAMNDSHVESGLRFEYVSSIPEAQKSSTGGVKNGVFTNISKIFFICHDHERLNAFAEQLQSVFAGRGLTFTFSALHCLDVMADGVNKGAALSIVAKRLLQTKTSEEAMARAVAFGDGLNDLEMLSQVGKGYIMGNANPRLKKELPGLEVIGTNDEQSVLKTLVKLFDLNISM